MQMLPHDRLACGTSTVAIDRSAFTYLTATVIAHQSKNSCQAAGAGSIELIFKPASSDKETNYASELSSYVNIITQLHVCQSATFAALGIARIHGADSDL